MTHTPERPPIVGFIMILLGGIFFAACIFLIFLLGALFE